jgi:CRISPR system Cascade subunit CasD
MELLLFRLYGSLASWGEIAVGESRHTATYPGKSAIIGLLAAAAGIKREDENAQQALQQGYAVAIEVLTPGQLLRDYHTIQAPDSVGQFNYRTRRDELLLGKERLGTILSSREYRSDMMALIAIRALNDAPYSLPELRQYLLKPKFHLYLGRKSCPLAVPLDPQLQEHENYYAAFRAYQHKPVLPTHEDAGLSGRDNYWLKISVERQYYWEGDAQDFSHNQDLLDTRQTTVRHDQPLSRKRWQFSPRQEHSLLMQGGE